MAVRSELMKGFAELAALRCEVRLRWCDVRSKLVELKARAVAAAVQGKWAKVKELLSARSTRTSSSPRGSRSRTRARPTAAPSSSSRSPPLEEGDKLVKKMTKIAATVDRDVDLIAELLRRGGVIPPRRIRDARAKIDDEFRKLTPEQLAAARAVFVPATVKPSDASPRRARQRAQGLLPSAVHPDDAERGDVGAPGGGKSRDGDKAEDGGGARTRSKLGGRWNRTSRCSSMSPTRANTRSASRAGKQSSLRSSSTTMAWARAFRRRPPCARA